MPDFPLVWRNATCWELKVWVEGAPARLCRVRPGSRQVLNVPAGAIALVQLCPVFLVWPDSVSPPIREWLGAPLGAVYPFDCSPEGVLYPDVEGGWCAELGLPLLDSGWDWYGFNWPRLRRELAERLPDPWLVPPAGLRAALAQGEWNARLLDPPAELFDVHWLVQAGADAAPLTKNLPVAAVWIPYSPRGTLPALDGEPTGVPALRLPPGYHEWLWAGRRVRLRLDRDGMAWWTVGDACPAEAQPAL